MRHQSIRTTPSVMFILSCLMVLCMVLFALFFPLFTKDTARVTVVDKERIVKRYGENLSAKYLVFTHHEDGELETFENTDILMLGKFNSSDVQGSLQVGDIVTLQVCGWRVPFLSLYRNIIKVE